MSEKRFHLSVMGEKPEAPAAPKIELPPEATLKDHVIAVLKSIFDPELPINVYELGLIYVLDVSDSGDVAIQMTLTSPNCPVAGSLPAEVQRKVAAIPGVNSAKVDLVWEPPWTKDRLSEEALLELGLM